MQQALRTKLLIGIFALAALGVVLTRQLRANNQTAVATSKLQQNETKQRKLTATTKLAF